jgi:anti-anti-sigma factor
MEVPILEIKTPWPLLNMEEKNGELAVSFHPDAFTGTAVWEVGLTLAQLVDEIDGCPFFLDFRNVDYLSGVGLEKLIFLNKRLQKEGRRLTIRNVGPNLMEVFSLTGLTRDFDIERVKARNLMI